MSKLELYFAGAEVPTWRKLLVQEEVPHVAVNYLHLKARLPLGKWTLEDHFPPDQKIFLLSGSSATEKKNWSPAQHEEFLESYVSARCGRGWASWSRCGARSGVLPCSDRWSRSTPTWECLRLPRVRRTSSPLSCVVQGLPCTGCPSAIPTTRPEVSTPQLSLPAGSRQRDSGRRSSGTRTACAAIRLTRSSRSAPGTV